VNEPWIHTPEAELKDFYWRAYNLVHTKAPHWLFIFHDSFNATLGFWGGFLVGCPNWGIDSHLYQAWNGPAPIETFVKSTCTESARLQNLQDNGLKLIVGEWSLATDNCAMWLNGFNDNLPGYPYVECMRVPCAEPYMGTQPGAPPPMGGGVMSDPHGQGESFVIDGMCPIDKPFPDEFGAMRELIKAKMFAYHFTHGHFYWNFRTEIAYRWSFLEVYTYTYTSLTYIVAMYTHTHIYICYIYIH
jgi:glucan 1,3-beta-glucosidase